MNAARERIGLVQKGAIYLLMLVFVGHLAELHPSLMFRGWGVMASAVGLLALGLSRNRQGFLEVMRLSPLFKFVLLFMFMVYASVPFSVYGTGAFNSAVAYGYVVIFFFSLVGMARGEEGVNTLLGAGFLVFLLLSAGVIINYGSARTTLDNSSYDPNDIAYILVTLLPVMFYYAQSRKSPLAKLIIFASLPLAVVSISLTQSRGAALAFIVMLVLVLRFEKVSFAKVILPGILLTVLVVYFVPDAFWERFSTLGDIESDYNYTSEDGRLHLWKVGLGFFAGHPLLGVGTGQFTSANGMFRGNYMTAHNAYIQVAAELGIAGCVAFLAMVFGPLRSLKRFVREERGQLALCKGMYVAFFTQAVAIFFLSVAYYFLLYYLLALFFALVCLQHRAESAVMDGQPRYTLRDRCCTREVSYESS